MATMKVRDLVKLLESNHWRFLRQRGSHQQDRHPDGRVVTVSGRPAEDVPEGTLKAILKSAGLVEREE